MTAADKYKAEKEQLEQHTLFLHVKHLCQKFQHFEDEVTKDAIDYNPHSFRYNSRMRTMYYQMLMEFLNTCADQELVDWAAEYMTLCDVYE